MVRNALILRIFGLRPKTTIHIGAGNGQDRDLYYQIGSKKVIWIEASLEKCHKITKSFPADVVLNLYVTKIRQEELNNRSAIKFSEEKPTIGVISASTPHKSLDEILTTHPIQPHPYPWLVVIDTDGAEVDILEGGERVLTKVSYLVIEQHFNWDNGEWHKEVSRLCLAYGFNRTLARQNHTKEYEDVLYTRFSKSRIFLIKCLDSVFYILKQCKHMINQKHLSTTYFNCKKCKK